MGEDTAFVWDSGSERAPRQPRVAPDTPPRQPPTAPTDEPVQTLPEPRPVTPPGWGTLKAAEAATGVQAATIRNWARKGRIPSEMEDTGSGTRRIVDIGATVERARTLGRLNIETSPADPDEGAPDAAASPPAATVPDDHVLVPIGAWDKMLLQLGNLHSAGQELADARERAAKAETEVRFLRERLSELRETRTPADDSPAAPEPQAADGPAPQPAMDRLVRRYRTLATRIRRRS